MKIRKTKISMNTAVKSKRTSARESGEHRPCDDDNDDPPVPTYQSRLIHCTRCNHPKETRWMQLRTVTGYRDINCANCKTHERCIQNWCQCKVTWHHCNLHRVDPTSHRPDKGPAKRKEGLTAPAPKLDSTRKAPLIELKECRTKKTRKYNAKGDDLNSHPQAKVEVSNNLPLEAIRCKVREREGLARLKRRSDDRADEVSTLPRPSKSTRTDNPCMSAALPLQVVRDAPASGK